MSCLHGDNRIYNNVFVQKWRGSETDVSEAMGFAFTDNRLVGNSVWDEFPTYESWISNFDFTKKTDMADMIQLSRIHYSRLPVWINSNAYFNGARNWKNEMNKLVSQTRVEVELIERDGKYYLETNIGDCLEGFVGELIDSEMLGKAFEAQERFENPDGSDIVFDTDYFGNARTRVIPGPFATFSPANPVA